jgi:hypothetical protein
LPVAGAVIWNCAARSPQLLPKGTITPVGPNSRIQGTNAELAPVSATSTMIACPAVAVNVHGSRSPTWIVPAWLPPFEIGPP